MKNVHKKLLVASSVTALALGFIGQAVFAVSPAVINLGSSGNFVVLAKTGISTTGATSITGDLGISPAQASYITGFDLILPAVSAFSTSALVTGKIYAPGYADPTPANLTTAVLDMQNAYTDGAGRAADVTELGAGNIGGMTLAPGVYKWGTDLLIPTDVTLSGGANGVWIFVVAQNLDISAAKSVILSGGARANNIFWVVGGQTTIGTTAVFNGNILGQTAIVLNTGAQLNGRALAQTAVTLDANTVTLSSSGAIVVTPTPTPTAIVTPAATPNVTPVATVSPTVTTNPTPTPTQTPTPAGAPAVTPNPRAALQAQINDLMATLRSLQAQVQARQGTPATASAFGQQVKAININLRKGSRGNDVAILQQFLISQNRGPAAEALVKAGVTSYYGEKTRAALAEFQAKVGISPALGNFGPITRAYLNSY